MPATTASAEEPARRAATARLPPDLTPGVDLPLFESATAFRPADAVRFTGGPAGTPSPPTPEYPCAKACRAA